MKKGNFAYTKKELGHIFLDMFDFLTSNQKAKIIYHSKGIENTLPLMTESVGIFSTIISHEHLDEIALAIKQNHFEHFLKNLEKENIKVITIDSAAYPERLKNIAQPPYLLYTKGNLDLLDVERNTIAIVGTRRPTKYGERITEKFARELSIHDFTVVAGLADGVDTIAHKTSMKHIGKTIAVLGSGFHKIYPSANEALFKRICEDGGLVVSEYKPSRQPRNYQFPLRNRIIVGLSRGVLITEASLKSGTNHTKNYAIEENRDLFAVCGNIDSLNSEGTNNIIKQFRDALVLDVKDILEHYHISPTPKKEAKLFQLSVIDECIMGVLIGKEEKHFDEIMSQTNLDVKTLNNTLTTLLLRGIIEKTAGNYYHRK